MKSLGVVPFLLLMGLRIAAAQHTEFHILKGEWIEIENDRKTILIDEVGRVWSRDGSILAGRVHEGATEGGGNFTFENDQITCAYDLTWTNEGKRMYWTLRAATRTSWLGPSCPKHTAYEMVYHAPEPPPAVAKAAPPPQSGLSDRGKALRDLVVQNATGGVVGRPEQQTALHAMQIVNQCAAKVSAIVVYWDDNRWNVVAPDVAPKSMTTVSKPKSKDPILTQANEWYVWANIPSAKVVWEGKYTFKDASAATGIWANFYKYTKFPADLPATLTCDEGLFAKR